MVPDMSAKLRVCVESNSNLAKRLGVWATLRATQDTARLFRQERLTNVVDMGDARCMTREVAPPSSDAGNKRG